MQFYSLASGLIWLCLTVLLGETGPDGFMPPYLLSWISTALCEIALLVWPRSWGATTDTWGIALLATKLLRIALLACMSGYTSCILRQSDRYRRVAGEEPSDEETQGLLTSGASGPVDSHISSANSVAYGSLNNELVRKGNDGDDSDGDNDEDNDDDKEIMALQEKRLQEHGGWLGYLRGFVIFLPCILPYKDRYTQFWLLVLISCVVVQRVLTLMIPRQLGTITDALTDYAGLSMNLPSSSNVSPDSRLWKEILIWGLLQFPTSALTTMFKDMANTRVSQFAYTELKAVSFAHVMNLSMDYHTAKSSGRLTKAIEQGTDLTSIIDNIFTAGPMLVDLVIAVIYLSSEFDFYMGFIVLTTSLIHIYATIKGNAKIVPMERVSSERARVENEILYDSITNWPTVAYHNRKKFEQDRYGRAVRTHVMGERKYYDCADYSFAVQDFVMDAGLLVAASVAAYRVTIGFSAVSNFVFLVSYWSSIKEPMASLSWTFRETSAHLVNAEWLFQLLLMKPSVRDKPTAKELSIKEGRVEFQDVSFSYDPQRPIIKGISFTAQSGRSVAFVGETGGGKSTILKLLYRFYDVGQGSITIDGYDIRDMTLDSLRDNLGAVPQDPSVFDQSILENVRYARPGASDEDVIAACKAAQIHDQILRFPAGYGTQLGERGVRLSGGELQRLAIARVILREPKIVILDEATSAVDSQTESSVQKALDILGAGRTMLIVAHRLSTVINADLIIVVEQGSIVEQGTHQELLKEDGRYARLWDMQTTAHGNGSGEASHELGE